MATAHQLKITLRDVKPPVWRRLLVPSDICLSDLAEVLMGAMGWAGYHLYEFRSDGRDYIDPRFDDPPEDGTDARRVKLAQVAGAGERFDFLYDFGDGWEHRVEVEPVTDVKGRQPVICLAGRRACPPEDIGGPWGYAEFLEAVGDPKHERHEELVEWVGGGFDPAAFDLAAVSEVLK